MAGLVAIVEASLIVITLYVVIKKLLLDRSDSLPLPPGPKGLPSLGNINDLPPAGMPEFQHWYKHKDRYGPVSSVTVLGQTIVLIHSKTVAFELMEKRANAHSGRPSMKFAFDMVGWGHGMAGLQYDSTHRLHRRYAYQQIGSKAAMSRYHPLEEAAVGRFLYRLHDSKGGNLEKHLKTQVAEVILSILYGYTIEPRQDDPLVDMVGQAMAQFSEAAVPGKWPVDMLPLLEYLPEWMPGAGFKRTARLWGDTLMGCVEIPYKFAKQRSHVPSFVSTAIEQADKTSGLDVTGEYALKWAAASLYFGAADTSVSTMEAFFLAMSMYPGVQRKAQEEIDRVVGGSRLPKFSDREAMPYVNALVDEAQRWHPVAPLGLPHATDKEDTIEGYRIPKGALLLANIWWFTRDPNTYHDPEVFKPERFLAPHNEPSATNVTFGFGRRICPGKAMADSSLWLTLTQSLAVFETHKALDDGGKVIEPEHGFSGGIIGRPTPFRVRVVARSGKHEDLIQRVMQEHPFEESDARDLSYHRASVA